jgi:thiol-disulfide isomerase/thioredoxin
MRAAALGVLSLTGCYDLVSDGGETVEWTAPENTWTVTTPPEDLVGVGFAEGDIVPDVRLTDQFGDEVSLWQFWGKVVVLDVSTIWCGPCQELAETTQETFEDYEEQGFMYVTVLQEDLYNEDPEIDDLLLWVNEYTLSTPVLDDGAYPQQTSAALPKADTWPGVLVIDRQMVVSERLDETVDAALRAAIEAIL